MAEGAARVHGRLRPAAGHTWIARNHFYVDLYPENPRGTFLDVRSHPEFAPQYAVLIKKAVEKGHVYAVGYKINRNGFREKEFTRDAHGSYRIAFLGDSFTYGEGVWAKDTYPRVFERLLADSTDLKIEVLNLARFDYDVKNVAHVLEGLALPLGAKEIFYGFVLNDPIRSKEFQATCPSPDELMRFEPGDLRSSLALVSLVREAIRRRRITARTIDWYRRMYSPENSGFSDTLATIRKMNRLSAEHGARFHLVIFPLFYSLRRGYPFCDLHRRIREFCLHEGIPCLDLLPYYEGKKATRFWVTSFNAHPNEIAHRIAARAIFEWRQSWAGHADPNRANAE